jgi:hypothetical protein
MFSLMVSWSPSLKFKIPAILHMSLILKVSNPILHVNTNWKQASIRIETQSS